MPYLKWKKIYLAFFKFSTWCVCTHKHYFILWVVSLQHWNNTFERNLKQPCLGVDQTLNFSASWHISQGYIPRIKENLIHNSVRCSVKQSNTRFYHISMIERSNVSLHLKFEILSSTKKTYKFCPFLKETLPNCKCHTFLDMNVLKHDLNKFEN